jgi:DNA modification methylase
MKFNKFYIEDSVSFMKENIESNSIDLTVTSPPYDNMRLYNGFSFDFESNAKELYRCTKNGGVVVWVVGDSVKDGNESGTSFRQALYFKEIGFNLFDTMIYFKNGGLNSGANNSYIQKFEYMFVLSKGKIKTSNIIEDRPNLYLNKETKRKRNPSDESFRIQDVVIKEVGKRYNIWVVNTGIPHSTHDEIAYKHPAIFPEKLAEDHIISWSNEGDVVFDPMCGSGTVCKMAFLNNRKFIGIDSNKNYINDICIPRLQQYNWINQ